MYRAFISYARADDRDEQIMRVVGALEMELSLLTGETESFWVDTKEVAWGVEFNQEIQAALLNSAFFIPFLTPRYFKSRYCRDEALWFVAEADRLGLRDLIKPIYYAPMPPGYDLGSDALFDRLMTFPNRSDWTRRRLLKLKSENCKLEINSMAKALQRARTRADAQEPQAIAPDRRAALTAAEPEGTDDSDGSSGNGSGAAGSLDVASSRARQSWDQMKKPLAAIGPLKEKQVEALRGAAELIETQRGQSLADRTRAEAQIVQAATPVSRELGAASSDFLRIAMGAERDVGDLLAMVGGNPTEVERVSAFLQDVVREGRSGAGNPAAYAPGSPLAELGAFKAVRSVGERIEMADLQVDDGQRILARLAERSAAVLAGAEIGLD